MERRRPDPWATADWTASWKRSIVNDQESSEARRALAAEARAWLETLRAPREYSQFESNGVIASIAHLACQFGAIRQIDRTTRGPLADESADAR